MLSDLELSSCLDVVLTLLEAGPKEELQAKRQHSQRVADIRENRDFEQQKHRNGVRRTFVAFAAPCPVQLAQM
jgi:hypothetical protein